jgi:hypothetical protein
MQIKKGTKSIENQLIEARNKGLQEIRSTESMKALGKFMSMDAFMWREPDFKMLTSAIKSFPFPLIWIGTHQQIKCALKYYPELLSNIESIIVYDQAHNKFDAEVIFKIPRIIGVESLNEALKITSAVSSPSRGLLFTTEGEFAKQNCESFTQFISTK